MFFKMTNSFTAHVMLFYHDTKILIFYNNLHCFKLCTNVVWHLIIIYAWKLSYSTFILKALEIWMVGISTQEVRKIWKVISLKNPIQEQVHIKLKTKPLSELATASDYFLKNPKINKIYINFT